MSELPIFHTKNLEVGKTYKGLINNKTFKVTGKKTEKLYTATGFYFEKPILQPLMKTNTVLLSVLTTVYTFRR